MSYRYDPDVLPEEETDENFFVRHWRGHLSLAKSWFLVGGAFSYVLVVVLAAAVVAVESESSSLRWIAVAWITFFALFVVLRVWATVGIWRSAGYHEARGGQPFWATTARVLLGLGVLASVSQGVSYGRQVWEYGQLAVGHDPLGDPAFLHFADHGREIAVWGTLTEGTADRFEELAKAAPALASVDLESQGGRILEAQRIAQYVRNHHLSTRVQTDCESACTLVLLAGQTRYADPEAKIGFHQPSFPGFTAEQQQAAIDANSREYIAAGMDEQFVERVMQTPPDNMWFPAHDELVAANVINGDPIVVGSDPSKDQLGREISQAAAQISAKGSTRIDRITKLVGAQADGHSLILKYALSEPVEVARAKKSMPDNLRAQVCNDEGSKELVARGGRYVFRYMEPSGKSFDLRVSACG